MSKRKAIPKKSLEERVRERAEAELDAVDTESAYDDTLNELYSFESVGGPFACLQPSYVLKECDNTAYRCGLNDWLDGESRDGERWETLDNGESYYERSEVDEIREEEQDKLDAGE